MDGSDDNGDDNPIVGGDPLDEIGNEDNENVVIDENDSNSDNRFPEVNEGDEFNGFVN